MVLAAPCRAMCERQYPDGLGWDGFAGSDGLAGPDCLGGLAGLVPGDRS